MRFSLSFPVVLLAVLVAAPAFAGELTDVVDAFDYDNDNPMDFHIEPTFRYEAETGTVAREAPGEFSTDIFAELDYVRRTTAIDIGMQLGLFRDLEFHLNMPIVISQRRTLSYADTDDGVVNQDNSSVDPTQARVTDDLNPLQADAFGPDAFGTYRYFQVRPDNEGPQRSGIGDIMFGFAWSPMNTSRIPQYATLTFSLDYVAPTGQFATGTNTGVGRGVHELQIGIAASRAFNFMEPYGGLRYVVPIASSNSLFEEPPGSTQDYVGPGMRGEVTAGSEFILYTDPSSGQHYTFDIGLDFGYVHAGRDYNPLFDALAASRCNGRTPAETGDSLFDADGRIDGTVYDPDEDVLPEDAACAWVIQQASNEETNNAVAPENRAYSHNGITDVDSHTFVGGHVGFNLQFSPYVEIRLRTNFLTESSHFITSANTGENFGTVTDVPGCVDDEDYVSLNPQCGERNPYYNPTLDGVGRRFYLEGIFDFSMQSTIAFQF